MSFRRRFTSAVRSPDKVAAAALHYVLTPIGHRDFRRFVVLSRSRTGSNLLISMLSSHPRIHAKGELLRRLDGRDPARVLGGVFGRQPFYVKAAGFKMFYYHPLDDQTGTTWKLLASVEDLHIIHLKRRNILRTLVSRAIAGHTNQWTAPARRETRRGHCTALTLSPDELRAGFRETRQWEQSSEHRFGTYPTITIEYEDLVDNPELVFGQACNFVKVPYQRPKTAITRQNSRSLRDTLANYDELKSEFAGSEWEPWFEE